MMRDSPHRCKYHRQMQMWALSVASGSKVSEQWKSFKSPAKSFWGVSNFVLFFIVYSCRLQFVIPQQLFFYFFNWELSLPNIHCIKSVTLFSFKINWILNVCLNYYNCTLCIITTGWLCCTSTVKTVINIYVHTYLHRNMYIFIDI